MKKILQTILLLLFIISTFSCKKYLEEKSDMRLSTATSIDNCEALLDDYNTINFTFPNETEIIADNYYAPSFLFDLLPEFTRDYYLWKGTVQYPGAWLQQYKVVVRANLVLEGLNNIKPTPKDLLKYNSVLGSAYFLRGLSFYTLSQIYSPDFGENDSEKKLGIPLRLTTNINVPSSRSSIEETYKQILSDYNKASELLPNSNKFRTRPSKPAVYAAIARLYTAIGNYDSAKIYSQKCLNIYDQLLDFNQLDKNSFSPIPRFNPEVLFHSQSQLELILQFGLALVDSTLMKTYEETDLRKSIFYYSMGDGTYSFKGGYDGGGNGRVFLFGGFATDEVYITLSECLAREGKIDSSMLILNKVLVNRYEAGKFIDRIAANKDDALKMILEERRKELVFRGVRWSDLRRLRKDLNYGVIPKRVVNGTTYELLPDSKRYTLLLPADVINLGGLSQNP